MANKFEAGQKVICIRNHKYHSPAPKIGEILTIDQVMGQYISFLPYNEEITKCFWDSSCFELFGNGTERVISERDILFDAREWVNILRNTPISKTTLTNIVEKNKN